jgi:hypothetical protein
MTFAGFCHFFFFNGLQASARLFARFENGESLARLARLPQCRLDPAQKIAGWTLIIERHSVRRTILRIDEIAVSPRGAGVPDFERDRMVSVLDAIRRDATLPPIEVVEAISDAYSHRLHHGRHRLAASIAVDFFLVPAVVVRDVDEIKRAEGMA